MKWLVRHYSWDVKKCLRGLVCLSGPVSSLMQPVLYGLLFFNILSNVGGVEGTSSLAIPSVRHMVRPSLQQPSWGRERGFGGVMGATTGVLNNYFTWHKRKRRTERISERYINLLPKIIYSCRHPLVPKPFSSVGFSPTCRCFGQKRPGLRAQCWLIIHLESLLVMLGTLLLRGLMLLRGMPLKLCDLLLSSCNGCFRNLLTSSDSGT